MVEVVMQSRQGAMTADVGCRMTIQFPRFQKDSCSVEPLFRLVTRSHDSCFEVFTGMLLFRLHG